ncbi:MAG: stage II sporulation protein E [Deltaproteobacteria bacterium]|nr:stage II sporulation protein E [Deltaproteobacteria bacterium]
MFRNLSIKQKLLWGIFLVSLISISIDTYLTYTAEKKDILEGIDASLKVAAYGVFHILPPEFHGRIEDQNSISDKEHLENVTLLTQFARETGGGVKYVYSYMKFGDRIRYISGSDDPEDIQKGTYDRFFTAYNTAPDSMHRSFIDGKIRYDQYTDQYGSFRSVFIPLKTANGKVFIVGADVTISSLEDRLNETVVSSVLFELGVFMVLFLSVYAIISRAIKPLTELTGHTQALIEQNFNWGESIRSKVISIHETKHDEVGKLAKALVQMETTLQTYIVNLKETTAAKERIESELAIARNIQMGFLPQTFPAFPNRTEFDLHAILEPAKEVGGDLYDYFLIDENRLFFLIGDVSDKGVPAALFMAVTKTLFETHALRGNASISEIMSRVNQELSRGNPWQMFVTAFAGILDLKTGEVVYSDGGHEPPILLRAGQKAEILKKKGGPALCFFDDFPYESDTFRLRPGDTLVLYTDGVTEAMNLEHKLFSSVRIQQALQIDVEAVPLAATIQRLFEQVKLFAGNVTQSDDIAILAIRYYGTI